MHHIKCRAAITVILLLQFTALDYCRALQRYDEGAKRSPLRSVDNDDVVEQQVDNMKSVLAVSGNKPKRKKKNHHEKIETSKERVDSTNERLDDQMRQEDNRSGKGHSSTNFRITEPQQLPRKEAHQSVEDITEPILSTGNNSIPLERSSVDKSESTLQKRPRIHPPNSIFRFFLSKGIIGRLMVMLLILVSELLSSFIPTIGNAFKSILPMSSAYHVSGSSAVSQKKKNKSHQAREADQLAFQQLQLAGKEGGKYRWVVSHDFLKRHEIGPYTTYHESPEHQENSQSKVVGIATNEHRPTSAIKDEEDEDASWIIDALSTSKNDAGTTEGGEKMGITRIFNGDNEFVKLDSQRQSRIHASIKIPPKKKIKRISFGSRLIGKFASTDNRFSRNFLGAYPGDAVPIEQAASASGLSELAKKYGWGDWIEEEDHDAKNGVKRYKKRKRQPRVQTNKPRNSYELESGGSMDGTDAFDEWNPPFPEITSITRSRRRSKTAMQTSIKSPRDNKKDVLSAPGKITEQKLSREEMLNPTYTSSKRTRPATELLTERRRILHEKESSNGS